VDPLSAGNPDDVFAQYASFRTSNENEAGIREAPICESDRGGGYVVVPESRRVSGNLELLEAVTSYSQIFPSRGRSYREASPELH